MHKVKSHKSVEQIAKKHRLEVSFVKRQLEMGIPIEHEHTKDKDLATDIALQHLDEIPDYYSRLKKMETDAKKHHKRFKDVNEATDGIGAKSKNYSLHKWFDDGGWVQAGGKYDGKPCAKQPGQKTKPYCRDPDDRKNMSKEEKNKRSINKRLNDPNPNRSGKAKMVTQESAGEKDACYTKVKSRYKIWPSAYASGALVKCRKVGAKNWGTKSEATEMVRYCPKCKKDETRNECKYGAKYWDMFSVPSALTTNQLKYNIATVHPGNFPESYDHEHSMARSELSTIVSAAKRLRKKMKGEGNVEAWVQSKITKAADYLDSAADYVDSGEMKEQVKPVDDLDRNNPYASFNRRVSAAGKLSDPKEKAKVLKSAIPLYPGSGLVKPVDEAINHPIDREVHRKRKAEESKRRKIKKIADRGSTEGERSAAKSKIKGPELPPFMESYEYSNWRRDFGLSEQSANDKSYPIGKIVGKDPITRKAIERYKLRSLMGPKVFDLKKPIEVNESKKSEMPCNKPKAEAHGSGETGKSHVVKACSNGKEKLIRFGQLGVKGSPKKKGESKEYANRRHRFQTRHAKNIARGPMSAAFWSNKVKW